MCSNCGSGFNAWVSREDGNNECEAFDQYKCQECGHEWWESTDLCDDGYYDDYDDDDDN